MGSSDAHGLPVAPPSLRLDGKAVWITGAGRGIGRALAYAFAGLGAELLLMGRTAATLEAVADEVRAAGGVALTVAGSVADAADVAAAADLAGRTWDRLDGLVNNAGISPSYDRSERVDPEGFSDVLDVNLTGTLRCCQAAFGMMAETGGGAIVNLSSVHGATGHERLAAYAASKGGVELLTRTLAVEWAGRGVRVNALAPGYLETDMTAGLREHDRLNAGLLGKIPMGRFGSPAEVVGAAAFLLSDAAAYVTGTTLVADGGWLAQ
ncbi:MAG TPA: glucose 1-dehydrogenase [Baekduia sp.]|nr:glucose 1-dehydrogenase [Baekduia sp.]